MTAAPPAAPSPYGSALLSMVRGIAGRGESEYGRAAESMEALVERGDVPVNLSYYAAMYSALCYDIAGYQGRAERMYGKMDASYGGELERIVPSRMHAKRLATGLSMLGRRRVGAFSEALSGAIRWLRLVESENGGLPGRGHDDDRTVMLSSMILLDDFFSALTGSVEGDATGRLAHEASRQYDELSAFDPSPHIEFAARLCLQLIRAASERSVAALAIGDDAKRGLLRSKKYELWPPQRRAVGAGLLDGQSVVCAAPPGSGKSLLAHLALAGTAGGRGGIAAYLVPTKSLSRQVGMDVKGVFGDKLRLAVSNRDAADDDDALRGLDLVVATYEKMGALLRRGKIDPEDIRTVIVDEVHGVGDEWEGMDLEMLLTRLRAAGPAGRQFVALSATASGGDARRLAEWLAARPVVDEWRPVDIGESICLDGWLHGRGGRDPPTRMPDTFAAMDGAGSQEKRLQACYAFVRRALIEGDRVLVSVHKRADASGVARGIGGMLRRASRIDPDLGEALRRGAAEREEAARSIEEVDAEMPPHAAGLADLLRSGIAYHHAGLGSGYRAAVEDAAERGRVRAVVAAGAPDAGTDMPFSTVVFHNPLSRAGNGRPYLDAAGYRSMAGRAGRTGRGGAGESVLLAMSDSDASRIRETLWSEDGGGLRSALGAALGGGGGRSEGRDRLLPHILSVISEKGAAAAGDVVDRLLSSWFCHSEPPDDARRSRIEACVREGIGRLEGMGLVSASGNGGAYEATPAGVAASGSMLAPGSFSMVRDCIGRLGRPGLGGGDLEAALLVVAASTAEVLGRYEGMAVGAEVPERLARLQRALGCPGGRGSARLATVLHHWAGSMPLAEIAERCGIAEARAGDVGDGLAADAAWILSAAAGMAREMPGAGEGIAGAIEDAAESCRLGTSDPHARILVKAGLRGMGRETAVRLAAHLRGRRGRIADAQRSKIMKLFAGNPAGAARLCESLENAGLMGGGGAPARAPPGPAGAPGGIPAARGGGGGGGGEPGPAPRGGAAARGPDGAPPAAAKLPDEAAYGDAG